MATLDRLPPCELVNALWGMHLNRIKHQKLMLMLAWLRLRAKVVACWMRDRLRMADFVQTLTLVKSLGINSLTRREQRLVRAFMARAEALACYARAAF